MTLPESQKFNYPTAERKVPIPNQNDRPIHGLRTDKNFIVSNAVNVILAPPRVVPEAEDPLKKRTYGKVPQYINRVKANIE